MRASEIRRTFLEFFRERDHRVFSSSPLVPEHPKAPLLTTAGMVQFIPYFSGEKPVEFARAASCQKCARTTDIEVIGTTARHHSFFEMLGNFSFGDYFKEDAIRWAWELSTHGFGLEADRIWVTVFETDEEAAKIWRDVVGLPEERIIRRGFDDNFWWMGVAGPGGPCSELFYDRGPAFGEVRGFQDGDRIMEYYNLVFTQYEVDDTGAIVGDLPRRNVDTGMGLERLASILQGVPTNFETDLLRPIIERAQDVTGRRYGADDRTDVSLRILADHARAATFLIGDGILPSNEDRGYVLRRLIRRAVRHATLLGVNDPVMPTLVDAVVATLGEAYPDMASNRAFIEQIASSEEEGFRATLGRGLVILDSAIAGARAETQTRLSSDVAFKLHDTYGFPFELTLEIANEAGLEIDREGFARLMDEQRERGRAARKVEERIDTALQDVLGEHGRTAFIGYERTEDEATVLAIVRDGERVAGAAEGDEVQVVLDHTPFYPEGGGQVGDRGAIEVDGARLEVLDTRRVLGDLIVHTARVARGEVETGATGVAGVDPVWRAATMRSHTATHILHAILRARLGDHARQAGSLVEPGRLRFDFPHFERVPREVLEDVEAIVNEHLLADEAVRAYETTMDEARERGAIALFEEKYGDIVRVVEVGDYSVELCGGTHVVRTGQVGLVKILGEGSIGSNLRRVEALTGADAISDFRRSRAVLEHVATLLKATPDEAPARVEKLLADLRTAQQQLEKARAAGERGRAQELAQQGEHIGDVIVVVSPVAEMRVDELQRFAGAVREHAGRSAIVVVGTETGGKGALVAVTDRATAERVDPKAVIARAAEAVGGRAGGKGPLATAVGPNAGAVGAALDLAREDARRLLG